MKKDWELTQEYFEPLLRWLDSDPDRAGQSYEKIRVRLIKVFECRGCCEAEDLADETINRVASKVKELAPSYEGDPALYFYGVANHIHLEYLRKTSAMRETLKKESASHPTSSDHSEPAEEAELESECLDSCMEQLPSDGRRLVLEYYADERAAKISHRKRLAEELGIGLNALRIRAHRIRLRLHDCVSDCLAKTAVN